VKANNLKCHKYRE